MVDRSWFDDQDLEERFIANFEELVVLALAFDLALIGERILKPHQLLDTCNKPPIVVLPNSSFVDPSKLTVMDRKVVEFSNFVQGSSSVQEYVSKFDNLSRFAPDLVNIEANRKEGKYQPKPIGATPRFYALTKGAGTSNMVSGQLPVANNSAYALMDTGASHSFIATSYVDKKDRKPEPMENRAVVNCKRRKVTFNPPREEPFLFQGTTREKNLAIISTLKAKKLLDDGCIVYLVNLIDKDGESKLQPTEVAVVCKFLEVFPEDLPGKSPDWEVEFEIELIPGTTPISKALYWMALVELKELEAQLQYYLDKGFIRQSHSPWGAPVLFVKKERQLLENVYRLP
ncbi:uncharacterized protein LOC133806878 [Humulus lupulus]|uniref:uncharacterized protein LOC133806878 n=1 Tax=Humulus lupulus TaxID=3486 RepID=UPI002B403256|nr:uncharacterized protein LOC133806878 [Humulus lupulus]